MTMKEILRYLESRQEILFAASDYIWDNPETAFREKKSAARLCEILSQEGFSLKKGVAGMSTAFTASFGSGKPVIGILGEFDALPAMSQQAEVTHAVPVKKGAPGHACGHNLLGVGALAGALAIKEYLKQNPGSGTVIYFGCPGEEGGGGKVFMVRAGLFKEIDCVLAWHPSYANIAVSGSTLANVRKVYIFRGRAAHASVSPHEGRSALDAAELMNVGSNYLREHIIPDARLHYAFLNAGGTAPNVVPAEAELIYLMRAPELSDVRAIAERVDDIARGAALMTGTEVECRFLKAYSNTIVNEPLLTLLKQTLAQAEGPVLTQEDLAFAADMAAAVGEPAQKAVAMLKKIPMPALEHAFADNPGLMQLGALPPLPLATPGKIRYASTDVGDVSWICPTVQFAGASWCAGTPGHSWQVVAQGKCAYAHKSILFAGEIFAGMAIHLFENPALVSVAKEDLLRRLAGRTYTCPIPADLKPRAPIGPVEV